MATKIAPKVKSPKESWQVLTGKLSLAVLETERRNRNLGAVEERSKIMDHLQKVRKRYESKEMTLNEAEAISQAIDWISQRNKRTSHRYGGLGRK